MRKTASIADTIDALQTAFELLEDGYLSADAEKAGLLDAVAALHEAEELLRVARVDAVDAVRDAGCTWAAIADRLGVRPQAVQQRYGG